MLRLLTGLLFINWEEARIICKRDKSLFSTTCTTLLHLSVSLKLKPRCKRSQREPQRCC